MVIILDKTSRELIAVCDTIAEAREVRRDYGIERTIPQIVCKTRITR